MKALGSLLILAAAHEASRYYDSPPSSTLLALQGSSRWFSQHRQRRMRSHFGAFAPVAWDLACEVAS